MTLNGIIAFILCFFSFNSITLQTGYITVVEDVRKISSPSPILPLLAKTNVRDLHRGISAIAELLVFYLLIHK